jgi:hypothetical protein
LFVDLDSGCPVARTNGKSKEGISNAWHRAFAGADDVSMMVDSWNPRCSMEGRVVLLDAPR